MADVDASFMDDDYCVESVSSYGAESESDFDDDFDDIQVVKAAPKKTQNAKAKKTTTKSKSKAPGKSKNKAISLDDSDDDVDDDDFEAMSSAPKAKVPVLAERSVNDANRSASSNDDGAGAKKSKKTVEETYTKMSQLEHILKRPDTYSKSYIMIAFHLNDVY